MTVSTESATVHTACEVSFRVGSMDYGTINVPVGAKVSRHTINKIVSPWYLDQEDFVKLCPKSFMIDGKVSHVYFMDADNYGISLPNANVKKDGYPSKKHLAHHY